MSKTVFMLDITTPFKTLSVEVDENKTLKECLDIADELSKSAGPYCYTMKMKKWIRFLSPQEAKNE